MCLEDTSYKLCLCLYKYIQMFIVNVRQRYFFSHKRIYTFVSTLLPFLTIKYLVKLCLHLVLLLLLLYSNACLFCLSVSISM